jgi:hypothetical protein
MKIDDLCTWQENLADLRRLRARSDHHGGHKPREARLWGVRVTWRRGNWLYERRGEIRKGAGSRQWGEVAGSLHQRLNRQIRQLISVTFLTPLSGWTRTPGGTRESFRKVIGGMKGGYLKMPQDYYLNLNEAHIKQLGALSTVGSPPALRRTL